MSLKEPNTTPTVTPLLITDLPPEILSTIFQIGVDNNGLSFPEAQPVVQTAKLPVFEIAISQTCSYFRKTALGNPLLWNSININAASSKQDLRRRINWSRPCLLDIRMDWSLQAPWMPSSDQTAMLVIILPESLRWRSVFIKYHKETADHPIIRRLCNCSAPNLEHLSLSVHAVENASSASVNSITDLPQIFQTGTPKLQFLRLRGIAIQHFRPQLAHLVTLHLEQTRKLPLLYSTFSSIIASSPYLTNLSVYGDIIHPTDWAGHDSLIYLPRLRSLRMYSESGAMYSGLLLAIDAPMLESLTLKGAHEQDLDAVWRLANRRNYSNLKYLHFSDFDLSVTAYARMFRTFLHVKEYSAVHLFPSESKLLAALLHGMTPGTDRLIIPWQGLESLRFSLDLYEEDTVLSEVAAIRKSLGCPLLRFFLTVEEDMLRQWSWERTPFNVEDNVEVRFVSTDRAWPLNEVQVGDREDTLFL